ncbi:MAG TPA: hypothetical protein VK465_16205 [Fibrobacteria bacterium]|nr:hypothetical protein [Fibrobacteria bacterium]
MRRVFSLVGLLFLAEVHAAFGFKIDGSLDKEAISAAYFEGEFNNVLPPLETYRQNFPETATKEDSIFVYKYLSVIYAADTATKARAISCMVQLLKLTPAISLIDLYISDQIQSLFNSVKKDFLEQQKYVRNFDANGYPISRDGEKPKSRKWVWWTLGGLGTAAAVTGAIVLLSDNEEEEPSRMKVVME